MSSSGARDTRFRVAVEGASGAAAFDGNHTNDVTSWIFNNEYWTAEKWEDSVLTLLYHTANGHLAWVVFPPQGFRISPLPADYLG